MMGQTDKDQKMSDRTLLTTNEDADYYNVTLNLIVKKGGAVLPNDIVPATTILP